MSFAVYKELVPPSAVEAAAWARLFPHSERSQLVVARRSQLDVFEVDECAAHLAAGTPVDRDQLMHAGRLKLLCSTAFAGNVQSVRVVRLGGSAARAVCGQDGVDALLLTFRDAKLSIVGLDPFSLTLRLLAMFNFEEDAVGPGSAVRAPRLAVVQRGLCALAEAVVDPLSRVAVMPVYDSKLAVLPFQRDVEGLGEADPDPSWRYAEEAAAGASAGLDGANEASAAAAAALEALARNIVRQPFLLDLGEIGTKGTLARGAVRGVCFLEGYRLDPAVALLVERGHTSPSRLGSLAHTCTVVAATLDVASRRAPVLWQRDGLPHDAYALVPVPEPLSGVLVLSPNAILYLSHYGYAGLALNAFAAATVDCAPGGAYPLDTNTAHDPTAPEVCIALEAARAAFLSPTTALLTTREGEVFLLRLHTRGGGAGGDVAFLTLLPARIQGVGCTALAVLPSRASFRVTSPGPGPLGDATVVAGDPGSGCDPESGDPAPRLRLGLLFQASRASDSLLSLYALPAACEGRPAAGEGGGGGAYGHKQLQLQTQPLDEDELLYGPSAGGLLGVGEDAAFPGGADPVAPQGSAPGVSNGPSAPEPGAAPAEDPVVSGSGRSGTGGPAAVDLDDEDALLYGSNGGGGGPAADAAPWAAGVPTAPVEDGAGSASGASAQQPQLDGSDDVAMQLQGSGSKLTAPSFAFSLFPLDHLPGLGPVADACLGRCARVLSADGAAPTQSAAPTELVLACGGDGPGASLAVLHRGLAPAPVTELRLHGCVGAWFLPYLHAQEAPPPAEEGAPPAEEGDAATAAAAAEGGAEEGGEGAQGKGQSPQAPTAPAPAPQRRGFLLLSMASGATRVLATGPTAPGGAGTEGGEDEEEAAALSEVPADATELLTGGPTLAAGVVLALRAGDPAPPPPTRLVQVHPDGVRVLSAAPTAASTQEIMRELPMEVGGLEAGGATIAAADFCDPFVLVRLSDGSLRCLEADAADGDLGVSAVAPAPAAAAEGEGEGEAAPPPPPAPGSVTAACLFRDTAGQLGAALRLPREDPEAVFAAVARRSGALELFSLPDWTRVFVSRGLPVGALVLSNKHATGGGEAAAPALGSRAPAPLSSGAGTAGEEDDDEAMFTFGREAEAPAPSPQPAPSDAPNAGPLHPGARTSSAPMSQYTLGAAAEPCEDAEQEEGGSSGGGAPSAQSGDPLAPLPRTVIRELALQALPTGGVALVALTSSDDLFVYMLQPPVPQAPPHGASPSSGDPFLPQFLDAGLPLQCHRASAARFVRLPACSSLVTRLPDPSAQDAPDGPPAPEAPSPAAEAAWRRFSPRRLVPFDDVTGWAGVAVLTPSPMWVLGTRGSAAVVPMSIPDVTGASGPGAIPGDGLFTPGLVSVFAPFSGPSCEAGCVLATQGFLQFATLPAPSWPACRARDSTTPGALPPPRRVPHGSLWGGEGVVPCPGNPLIAAGIAGGVSGLRGAHLPMPLALAGVPAGGGFASDVMAEAGGVVAAVVEAGGDAQDAAAADAVVAGEGEEGVANGSPPPAPPAPAAAGHAYSTAGPGAVDLTLPGAGTPGCAPLSRTYLHPHGETPAPSHHHVRAVAYLEGASAEAGARCLNAWFAAAKEEAAAGGPDAPAPPLPPTPSQLACALLPLYAASVYTPKARNHPGDLLTLKEAAAAEAGAGQQPGEYAQVDYGDHIEETTAAAEAPGMAGSRSGKALAALGAPPATDPQYTIRLYGGSAGGGGVPTGPGAPSSAPWALLDSFPLRPLERAVCLKELTLGDGTPANRAEPLLVVGTAQMGPRAEEGLPGGRVLVFRILHAPPTPDAGGAYPCLSLLFDGEFRGPITSLAPLACKSRDKGDTHHVVVGWGRQAQVLQWHRRPSGDPELRVISRIDACGAWVRDVAVASGYVLVADVLSSIKFLKWREEDHTLMPLAADADGALARAACVDMLVHEKTLGLLGVNDAGALAVTQYSPKDAGNRLVRAADFQLPSPVARLLRTRFAAPVGTPAATARRRNVVLCPSLDGRLGALVPLEEPLFRRLLALQRCMHYSLPHAGGLNPGAWRQFRPASPHAAEQPRSRNVLDGPLLWRYPTLDGRLQLQLASAAGSSVDALLEGLRHVEIVSASF